MDLVHPVMVSNAALDGLAARTLPDISLYDDVIKWKYFSRYWRFVQGIQRSPVTRSFDNFFDLNKRLNKPLWGWWFESPSRSLL